jgi:hypothetical protein
MKLNKYIVASALLTLACTSFGQVKYRRSNLTMVLIEDNSLGKEKDMVINAYNANPFPDKYNQHDIEDKNFSTEKMKLTKEDYLKAGFYKDTLKTPLDFIKAKKKPLNKVRYLNNELTIGVLEPTDEQLTNIYVNKYINEKKIAKQVVATWFNRSKDGKSMDWSLLKERALYSANAGEKADDTEQALTDKLIKDVDVVGNSFVVFNKMKFFENEPVARLIRDVAKAEAMKQLAGKPEIIVKNALAAIDKGYELTKEGYTVQCNTYLYQLDWNEQIAKKTQDYFFNSNLLDKRSQIWDTTNLYKMKFVGKTISGSIVVGGKKSIQEIIDLQVKRTMNNAMAKLQKENVVFRTVSPISTVGPLTSQIGTKEGVEPGQKFEILTAKYDEFGIPKWVSKGKVKVSKKHPIWDNLPGAEVKDATGNPLPTFSTFKGGKNAEPGLDFIRLIK